MNTFSSNTDTDIFLGLFPIFVLNLAHSDIVDTLGESNKLAQNLKLICVFSRSNIQHYANCLFNRYGQFKNCLLKKYVP